MQQSTTPIGEDATRGPWIDSRACATVNVDVFFDRNPEPALKICAACPVKDPCLAATLDVEHGVTGGVTAATRAEMREQAGVSVRTYESLFNPPRTLPPLESKYTNLVARQKHGLSKAALHEGYLEAQRKWEAA